MYKHKLWLFSMHKDMEWLILGTVRPFENIFLNFFPVARAYNYDGAD